MHNRYNRNHKYVSLLNNLFKYVQRVYHMHFKDIEVSGITTIVFNRKREWIKQPDTRWVESKGYLNCDHDEMMFIVNNLKDKPTARMWVHGYTLNIETRYWKGDECVSQSGTI